jgi:hypothetical protein
MKTKKSIRTLEDAIKRYFKVASKGNGVVAVAQPSNTSDCNRKGIWHLRNGNGLLAKVFPCGHVDFGN